MEKTQSGFHKLISYALVLAMAWTMCGGYLLTPYVSSAFAATSLETLVTSPGKQFYTGEAITPFSGSFKVRIDGKKTTITEGTDYTVTYTNNVEKGTATAVVTGMGNYEGTATVTFEIADYAMDVYAGETAKGSLSRAQLEKLAQDSTDNTKAACYQFGTTVVYVPAKQYVTYATLAEEMGVASYESCTTVATDGFEGTFTYQVATEGKYFPAQTAAAYATDGAEAVPAVAALQWSTSDITTSASAAATAAASVTPSTLVRTFVGALESDYTAGKIAGSRFVTNVDTVKFNNATEGTCIKKLISAPCKQFYTGQEIKPLSGSIKINKLRLTEGTDYIVTYTNNINKTTTRSLASATIEGKGKYFGSITVQFQIVDYSMAVSYNGTKVRELSRAQLEELAANSTDNTKAACFQFGTTVVYVPAKQYVTYATLASLLNLYSYESCTTAAPDGFSGTFTYQVATQGKYFPAQTTSAYSVEGAQAVPAVAALQWSTANIATSASAAATVASQGTMDKTVRTFMGALESDYAEGNIYGNRFVTNVDTVNFNDAVARIPISDATIEVADGNYVFDGTAKQPGVTVTYNGTALSSKTDYKVAYSDCFKAGNATVTITGTGKYSGVVAKSYKIAKRSFDMTGVTFSSKTVAYNGKSQAITVSGLPEGLKAVYSNNTRTAVGTSKATVTFVSTSENYEAPAPMTATLTVVKAAQSVKFAKSTVSKSFKAKSGKLAAAKTIKVSAAGKTAISYKLTSVPSKAKKYIKINSKTGKITVKKGLKKGTYKIKVKATAAGTASYYGNSANAVVTVKVK